MGRIIATILIGGLRRSDFESAVGFRLACLPLDPEWTLLRMWVDRLIAAGASEIRIITDDQSDVQLVRESDFLRGRHAGTEILLQREKASHRGTAGVLRDSCSDLEDADRVIWIEPHCLPPVDLRPLLESAVDGSVVVGIAGLDQPAGAYVLPASVLREVPRIGYQDFKEQFLVSIASIGVRIVPIRLSNGSIRVHSRGSYLEAIAAAGGNRRVSAAAEIEPTALVEGNSIVMAGARIGAGAVILDAVVMENAAVGDGAVVARSVVPTARRVAPRSLVVDRVVDIESSDATDELVAVGRLHDGSAT